MIGLSVVLQAALLPSALSCPIGEQRRSMLGSEDVRSLQQTESSPRDSASSFHPCGWFVLPQKRLEPALATGFLGGRSDQERQQQHPFGCQPTASPLLRGGSRGDAAWFCYGK